jgi:hypothetical protein
VLGLMMERWVMLCWIWQWRGGCGCVGLGDGEVGLALVGFHSFIQDDSLVSQVASFCSKRWTLSTGTGRA